MEFPISEVEWQKMFHSRTVPINSNMTFSTVFPDNTEDMEDWTEKWENQYKGWKEAMNVSTCYSRFDSVKEYLKRKLFKIKGMVELENAMPKQVW